MTDTASFVKVANPLQFGSTDDKLCSIDAYTQTTPDTTYNTTGLDFNLNTGLSDYLNIPALGGPIISSITKDGLLKVNLDSLKNGILAANSTLKNALTMVNNGLSIANNLKSQVTATVNGVTSMIKNANLSSLQGIATAIGSIAGASLPVSFKDISGLSALSTNILSEATKLGVPNSFTTFANNIGNNSILANVTKNILPIVAKTSNVNMLSQIANSAISKQVNSLVPGFTKSFVSNFKLPTSATVKDIANIGTMAVSALTKIDNTLNTKSIGGKLFNSIDIASNASDDFKKALKNSTAINESWSNYLTSTTKTFSSGSSFDYLTSNYFSSTSTVTKDLVGNISSVTGTNSLGDISTLIYNSDGSKRLSTDMCSISTDTDVVNRISPTTISNITEVKTVTVHDSALDPYMNGDISDVSMEGGKRVYYSYTASGERTKMKHRGDGYVDVTITPSSSIGSNTSTTDFNASNLLTTSFTNGSSSLLNLDRSLTLDYSDATSSTSVVFKKPTGDQIANFVNAGNTFKSADVTDNPVALNAVVASTDVISELKSSSTDSIYEVTGD